MSEFFRGWRRKVGLLTLLMACVLIGAWMRSLIFSDQLGFSIGASNYFLSSANGCFRWTRYAHIVNDSPLHVYNIDPAYFRSRRILWKSFKGFPLEEEEPIDYLTIKWNRHWSSCGFEFGNGLIHGDSPMGVWSFPYWIGILLTGLSALLLIIKPRKLTQMKLTEPVAVEGM